MWQKSAVDQAKLNGDHSRSHQRTSISQSHLVSSSGTYNIDTCRRRIEVVALLLVQLQVHRLYLLHNNPLTAPSLTAPLLCGKNKGAGCEWIDSIVAARFRWIVPIYFMDTCICLAGSSWPPSSAGQPACMQWGWARTISKRVDRGAWSRFAECTCLGATVDGETGWLSGAQSSADWVITSSIPSLRSVYNGTGNWQRRNILLWYWAQQFHWRQVKWSGVEEEESLSCTSGRVWCDFWKGHLSHHHHRRVRSSKVSLATASQKEAF